MRLNRLHLLTAFLILTTFACASRGPALGQMDADRLFDYGMEQLEEQDWSDAVAAFERFNATFADHPRAMEARFRAAEAYMGNEEYVTAAVEFDRLAADFPLGPWADEARLQVCNAYAALSPPPPLDQEYTRSAIGHCESLITYHPDSPFVAEARETAERLTNRLAEKEYRTAEHYFGRNAFDSSIIYYQAIVDTYPATVWAPRALLRLVQAYERLSYEDEAEAARQRLLREFPDSPEARQVSGVPIAAAS